MVKNMSMSDFTQKGALNRLRDTMQTTSNKTTGSGAIAVSITTPETNKKWIIDEIRLHLSNTGDAENFTVTLNSATSSAYDYNILTQLMTSVQDLRFVPTGDKIIFDADDVVDIAYTNSSARTYGLEVITRAVF